MSEHHQRIETQLVHAGEPLPRIAGAVEMPIFQSATYEYAGEGSYHDVRYLRINNTPSQQALHAKLAVLEGAEAALVTASGMAAISTTLLSVLSPGDHLLAQRCLLGLGISDGLLRLSVGIEATEDLLEDLRQALQ
jgi:cystathionine beta-lyase/cystathionine gamma-synthase